MRAVGAPGSLNTGTPGAAQRCPCFFPPCIKFAKSWGTQESFKAQKGLQEQKSLLHPFYTHQPSHTVFFKTSQKLLDSRTAAEKALISRQVTFAPRCAYPFFVYKSRELWNQTHSKMMTNRNLGACCTSVKTTNLRIPWKGPDYKHSHALKSPPVLLCFSQRINKRLTSLGKKKDKKNK